MRINIDHMSITVRNLERSIAFYRDILGMELLYIYEDGGPVAEGLKLPGAASAPLFPSKSTKLE